jgi:hypothetical protein
MNRSQFLFLIGVLAVLAAAGGGVMWWKSGEWRSTDIRLGQRLVPGLVAANVGEIRLQESSGVVTLEFRDGVWQVKERGAYPASVDRIGEFLAKLADLKIAQVEPMADSQRARLQLVEPKGPDVKDAGIVVELKDKAGKPLARLLLGKMVVRQSATTAPTKGSPGPSGRYVAPAEPGVVAVVSDSLSQAEAKAELWLAKDLIRVTGARRMSSFGPDGKMRWSVARESESADWKSTVAGDKLDNNKVQDLVSVLIYIALADVAPDASKAGFERGPTLKIHTFNNYDYSLTFGDRQGELRFMKIGLIGNPPKTRPPEKGDKPGEKEKQDKEYSDNYQGMLAQVEREKKAEGKVFLVRNSDIEALLRDRAQLLPEKKKDDRKK